MLKMIRVAWLVLALSGAAYAGEIGYGVTAQGIIPNGAKAAGEIQNGGGAQTAGEMPFGATPDGDLPYGLNAAGEMPNGGGGGDGGSRIQAADLALSALSGVFRLI